MDCEWSRNRCVATPDQTHALGWMWGMRLLLRLLLLLRQLLLLTSVLETEKEGCAELLPNTNDSCSR